MLLVIFIIFLCAGFSPTLATTRPKYSHTCHIPNRAKSLFYFESYKDCMAQKKATRAKVTPEIELEENTSGFTCEYKSNLWVQVNVWAQYPRGLNLDEWDVDITESPITLTFGSRSGESPCTQAITASRSCVKADHICTTPGSAACGGAVLTSWFVALFFVYKGL